MKICIVGTGYVGLVAGTGFADFGNEVICTDINTRKINGLNSGKIPIYEPGLKSLVKKNVNEDRLFFSTNIGESIAKSDVVFIAVGTPPKKDGSANLTYVYDVAQMIAKKAVGFTVVVNKSTVPVGTGAKVAAILKENAPLKDFAVVSNPEFLKEGDAINDFMKPQRIVIGTDDQRAMKIMKELYAPFTLTKERMLLMDVKSAEVTKYACNSMLATRISFMNEIARLCDKVGADVNSVRAGMASDDRIGPRFLFPGVGYGGSCFPKDIRAIITTAQENDLQFNILRSVEKVNEEQKKILANLTLEHFGQNIKNSTITIWGLAFKPKTDDVRDTPAKVIIDKLLKAGATVKLHDPEAMKEFKKILPPSDKVIYCKSNYDAVKNSDALLLVTEWHIYRTPDFDKIKKLMNEHVIFDGRNIWNPDNIKKRGFKYFSIGRK